jgi:hypothetical protein
MDYPLIYEYITGHPSNPAVIFPAMGNRYYRFYHLLEGISQGACPDTPLSVSLR